MNLTANTSPETAAAKIINPAEHPQVTQQLSENVILTTVDDLYNWAKMSSLYPLMFGTACCFIEFSAMLGARFDERSLWDVSPHNSQASRFANYRRHDYDEIRSGFGAPLRTNAGTEICNCNGRLHDYWRNVQCRFSQCSAGCR